MVKHDISRANLARKHTSSTNEDRSALLKAGKAHRRDLAKKGVISSSVHQVPLETEDHHLLKIRLLNLTRNPLPLSSVEPLEEEDLDPDMVPKGFVFISSDEYQKIAADSKIYMLEIDEKVKMQLAANKDKAKTPAPVPKNFSTQKRKRLNSALTSAIASSSRTPILDDAPDLSDPNHNSSDHDNDDEHSPPPQKKTKTSATTRGRKRKSTKVIKSRPEIESEDEVRTEEENPEIETPLSKVGPPTGVKGTRRKRARGKGKST